MMRHTLAMAVLMNTASSLSLFERQNFPYGTLSGFGPGELPNPSDSRDLQDLFETAGRSPNTSSNAEFQFGEESWSWRVNLTNVNVGDDLYAANIQFDLQWPGGESLQSFLEGRDPLTTSSSQTQQNICVGTYSWAVPSNVTEQYSGNDEGNCSNVLGSECVASLAEAIRQGGPCSRFDVGTTLSSCGDTLATSTVGGGMVLDLGNSSQPRQSYRNDSLQSGDSIYFLTYQPLPMANLSNYAAAETRLNMLFVGGGSVLEPALLCQVLNPSAMSAASSTAKGPMLTISWALRLIVLAIYV